MIKKFTADFETIVDEKETRVWAVGICEIGNTDNFQHGNSIDFFMDFISKKNKNYVIYFHNLKFDGEFIFIHLLQLHALL